MRLIATGLLPCAALLISACAPDAPETPQETVEPPRTDNAILWIQHAAEFRALAMQAYAGASRDLPGFIADPTWTVMSGVAVDPEMPTAIILDVDETAVSNFNFQLDHLPYSSEKHYRWSRDHHAVPIPGAVEFVDSAQAAGVEVFFVTNRPCEEIDGVAGRCPQKESTLGDLREAGFDTDAEHVMLAWEQPGWGKEKLTRRLHVAETHRVIMLFGDDISDFIACTRSKPVEPCTEVATRASRHAMLNDAEHLLGHGWYVLPNPMHGSWTTVE